MIDRVAEYIARNCEGGAHFELITEAEADRLRGVIWNRVRHAKLVDFGEGIVVLMLYPEDKIEGLNVLAEVRAQ